MVIFRCTKKLLTRLHEPGRSVNEASTTALGDWYVTLLVARPQWLLIGVSETSRLPLEVGAELVVAAARAKAEGARLSPPDHRRGKTGDRRLAR